MRSIGRGVNYPNFECVVINNTPDPGILAADRSAFSELGEHFKFVRVENLKGFKAGALRLAMTRTAPDAQIIGVIDADYVVDPDWFKDLVPAFANPRVGLVQAPQDHRDGDRSSLHAAMNAEYAGFFDIGMVERNEVNAIIVHGTMLLIRRSALEPLGAGRATRLLRIPTSASPFWSAAGACTTPITGTAGGCCRRTIRPSRRSATGGSVVRCKSSKNTGGSSCPARPCSMRIRSTHSWLAGSHGSAESLLGSRPHC